jgi:hypothetical protein
MLRTELSTLQHDWAWPSITMVERHQLLVDTATP